EVGPGDGDHRRQGVAHARALEVRGEQPTTLAMLVASDERERARAEQPADRGGPLVLEIATLAEEDPVAGLGADQKHGRLAEDVRAKYAAVSGDAPVHEAVRRAQKFEGLTE